MTSHVASQAGRSATKAGRWTTEAGRWATEEDNDDDNFRQLYLQNYSSEKFQILTRSVFGAQLQKWSFE